jgi:hypothetical protein
MIFGRTDREPTEGEVREAEAGLRALLAGRRLRRAGPADDPRALALAAGPLLVEMVERAWTLGWQPVELRWHVRRRATAAATAVLDGAVRAQAATVAGHDVHPAWRAQLDALGVAVPDRALPLDRRWLRDAPALLDAATVLAVLVALAALPQLPLLLPPPGRPDIALDASAPDLDLLAAGIDPRVLERVRALLAKAESTEFEAEAEAFTAKAHELMTRHSLEHAVVAGRGDHRARPVARRLRIDDPYAGAKAYLVQVVAEASRCRAVSHRGISMSTVVGFESDVEAVEVLYTSLLVQAQTALRGLAGASTSGARERSRGFRSSFLHGFAQRIGDRLVAAGDAAVAEVDRARGGALVPVLAEREADVEGELGRLFPRVVSSGPGRPTPWATGPGRRRPSGPTSRGTAWPPAAADQAGAAGRARVNVAPWPGSEATVAWPPWASAMAATIDRPSPEPPVARARALSAR